MDKVRFLWKNETCMLTSYNAGFRDKAKCARTDIILRLRSISTYNSLSLAIFTKARSKANRRTLDYLWVIHSTNTKGKMVIKHRLESYTHNTCKYTTLHQYSRVYWKR